MVEGARHAAGPRADGSSAVLARSKSAVVRVQRDQRLVANPKDVTLDGATSRTSTTSPA
jgi:hypothetical protein